jgi:hypothetical protein
LNYAGNPEKAHKSGNKKEHFPGSDLIACQMAFREYNADDQEYSKPHQLE